MARKPKNAGIEQDNSDIAEETQPAEYVAAEHASEDDTLVVPYSIGQLENVIDMGGSIDEYEEITDDKEADDKAKPGLPATDAEEGDVGVVREDDYFLKHKDFDPDEWAYGDDQ